MSHAIPLHNHQPNDLRSAEMLLEYLQPLQHFLENTHLTEICINRPQEVWTEGPTGWEQFAVESLTLNHCQQIAILIASYNNTAINKQKPILSAVLPDRSRVQVIIPPACEADTVSITIRKPSQQNWTLQELEQLGSFKNTQTASHELKPFEHELLQLQANKQYAQFLELAVKTKRTIVIAGKTGSGKTTVAKSLMHCIPASERLITLEDAHELFLNGQPNKVHLFFERDAGPNAISARQALAATLRMKPDRILLGELRGDEAWEFIKSVHTGHPGSITTMHANGAFEAFEQLVSLVKDSPTGLHLDAHYVRQRLFSTIDIVLFYADKKLQEVYYDPAIKRQNAL